MLSRSPGVHQKTGWLGGKFNMTLGLWVWDNNELMVYEKWWQRPVDWYRNTKQDMYMDKYGIFYNNYATTTSSPIYCEKEYGMY